MHQDDITTKQDSIRGCIFGGAVGDALGYSVEFLTEKEIFSKYGSHGITEYKKDTYTGKALISDDTQMTLFTAAGLMIGDTRGKMRGIQSSPRHYVARAYLDWLLDVPELYSRRAPGITCLNASPFQTAEFIKKNRRFDICTILQDI